MKGKPGEISVALTQVDQCSKLFVSNMW